MRRLLVPLAAAALAAAGALTGCTTVPTVTATPNTDLLDGQEVAVNGAGYAANSTVGVIECPTGADSIDDCDSETATTLSADGGGGFSTTVFVKAVINDGHDVDIDCRVAGSCVIVSVFVHGFQNMATAPLTFRAQAEPVGVTPIAFT